MGREPSFSGCWNWLIQIPGAIVAIVFAIYMIVDALLLAGSIKQNKVALICGLVLSRIVILGLVLWIPITVSFRDIDKDLFLQVSLVSAFTLTSIGLRLWTFFIGVGTLQEVMLIEN